MKKFVFASVMALASMSLVVVPKLQAQAADSGTISIKDPAEFNAYQMFHTQTDPKQKIAAGESFLKTYPQSQVKGSVLDELVDAYQATGDQDGVLSAANRLLQVDPNNLKAILYSVLIKKTQCGKTSDAQTCDDAAALAQKGLAATKPAATSDDEWKKLTHAAYPIFNSAIALDDVVSKKDYKAAQDQYTTELKLFSDDESKSAGLQDSLLLAQAYSQPGSSQQLIPAIWFYARVWDFAPAQYKAQIEPKLEYYYKKYHGGLDGLDAVKQKAATTTFPPADFTIAPAKSPAEQIHDLIAQTPDLNSLALGDKETVLAMGSKDDADKLWALLQGKETQVPGIVIAVTPDQIKVAVTQDAKDAKVADFIVNLKKPLTDAEQKVIIVGFEFKTQPDAELVGTYDTYRQVPATDKTSQSAEIVLKDGEYLPPEKKKAPVRKPTAAHKPAAQ
jgi:hypothetical protein